MKIPSEWIPVIAVVSALAGNWAVETVKGKFGREAREDEKDFKRRDEWRAEVAGLEKRLAEAHAETEKERKERRRLEGELDKASRDNILLMTTEVPPRGGTIKPEFLGGSDEE